MQFSDIIIMQLRDRKHNFSALCNFVSGCRAKSEHIKVLNIIVHWTVIIGYGFETFKIWSQNAM